MSLRPAVIQPVPEETARVARAAFRKGNPLLSLRDELGAIFADAWITYQYEMYERVERGECQEWERERCDCGEE